MLIKLLPLLPLPGFSTVANAKPLHSLQTCKTPYHPSCFLRLLSWASVQQSHKENNSHGCCKITLEWTQSHRRYTSKDIKWFYLTQHHPWLKTAMIRDRLWPHFCKYSLWLMLVIKPSTVVTRPPSVPAESSRSSSATVTDAVSDCNNPPKPKVNHISDKESLEKYYSGSTKLCARIYWNSAIGHAVEQTKNCTLLTS